MHPETAARFGVAALQKARLRSADRAVEVTIELDPSQRQDLVVAYNETAVRPEPLSPTGPVGNPPRSKPGHERKLLSPLRLCNPSRWHPFCSKHP